MCIHPLQSRLQRCFQLGGFLGQDLVVWEIGALNEDQKNKLGNFGLDNIR